MNYEITSIHRGVKRGWIEVDGAKVDGKVCTKCGLMQPLSNYTPNKSAYDGHFNICKKCRAERQREYAKEKPEIRRKSERKWRENHPDKVKEMAKRSRKKNIDGYRRRLREWRKKNPEKSKEINRRYRVNNLEKVKESSKKWREANKDKIVLYAANRRARLRGLPCNFDDEWAELLLKLYGGCIVTGEKEDIHWDHFIPVSTGKGGTTYGNMVPLKSTLNIRKSNKNPIEFLLDEGVTYEKLCDILYILAWLNKMTVIEYVRYVYECFGVTNEGVKRSG